MAFYDLPFCELPCKSGVSALALSVALALSAPALAHEGHDHSIPAAAMTVAPAAQAADIVRDPTDLPLPITRRTSATMRVDLETVEREGQLADGTTFKYWTFNGKVPGPMIRVRIGDTVEVHLKNAPGNDMMHNVDFHAVAGMHGGGHATEAAPGEEKGFTFKATKAGLYVYHCATPMVAQHISSGMYGMILVEPEEGLDKVDHEFYVMQGEIYTEEAFGTKGEATFSPDKLMNERPEYFVFNGAVNTLSLQGNHKMHAKVGETVRIFFGVGGPNYTSSFHVIGTIFDNAYATGSLMTAPVQDVQTISVPPGGATITEMTMQEPGDFVLVDHALVREERGLGGIIHVDGPANRAIFHEGLDSIASAGKSAPMTIGAAHPAPAQAPALAAPRVDAKPGAYEVKELNHGDKGAFVFAPDLIRI
jgi:nitrite reductase (NO-forming)